MWWGDGPGNLGQIKGREQRHSPIQSALGERHRVTGTVLYLGDRAVTNMDHEGSARVRKK